MKCLVAAFFAAVLLVFGQPTGASAHANLAGSHPVRDAVLQEAPTDIRLQFTEEINAALSQIVLEDEAGNTISGKVSASGERALLFEMAEPLPKGRYKVRWQALSVDTHVTEGSFRFAVGMPLEKETPQDAISLDGAEDAAGPEGAAPVDPPVAVAPADRGAETAPSTQPSEGTGNAPSAQSGGSPGNAPSAQEDRNAALNGSVPSAQPPGQTEAAAAGDAPDRGESPSLPPHGEAITNESDAGSVEDAPEAAVQPAASDNPTRPTATTQPQDDSEHAGHSGTLEPDAVPGGGADDSSHGSHSSAAAGDHSRHDEHRTASRYEMLHRCLRIVELFATAAVAAMLFMRRCLWSDKNGAPPAFLALSAERMVYGLAIAVFAVAGLLHVWTLAYEFGRLAGRSVWELSPIILQSTMTGQAAWIRLLPPALMLALTYVPAHGAAGRARAVASAQALSAAGLIVLFPLTGHASGTEGNVLYAMLTHSMHIAVAVVWFGGLFGIWAMTVAKLPYLVMKETVERFSRVALPAIIAVALTGIGLALLRVDSWSALFQSGYGRLIVLKSLLLLLVIGIGALHRLWFIPRLEAGADASDRQESGKRYGGIAGKLMIGIRIEIAAAVLLFVLAGILSTTAPPEKTAAAEPLYWHVMGDKAHMSMRLEWDGTDSQLYRLDVWLPEGLGAPQRVTVSVAGVNESADIDIPFEYKTGGPDPYGFPGFDKYSYEAYGHFLPPQQNWTMLIEISDSAGETHIYRKTLSALQSEAEL